MLRAGRLTFDLSSDNCELCDLGQVSNLSELHFLHMQNGNKNNICLLRLWQGLNEMKCTKTHPFYVPKNFALVTVLPSLLGHQFFCFLLKVLFPTIPMTSIDLKATSVAHTTVNKSTLHDSM